MDDNFEASIIAKVRELLENDPENSLRMCDLGITLAKVGKKPVGTKLKQLLHKDPNVAKDFDITGDFGSEKISLTYKVGPSFQKIAIKAGLAPNGTANHSRTQSLIKVEKSTHQIVKNNHDSDRNNSQRPASAHELAGAGKIYKALYVADKKDAGHVKPRINSDRGDTGGRLYNTTNVNTKESGRNQIQNNESVDSEISLLYTKDGPYKKDIDQSDIDTSSILTLDVVNKYKNTQHYTSIIKARLPHLSLLGEIMDFGVFDNERNSNYTAPFDPKVYQQKPLYQKNVNQRVYMNMNASNPLSTLICGSDGAEIINTLSVILENALIDNDHRIGSSRAMSVAVCHFDPFASRKPCQAALLGISSKSLSPGGKIQLLPSSVKVAVYVLPWNYNKMCSLYADIPNTEVLPLLFSVKDLTPTMLMTLITPTVAENTDTSFISEIIQALLRISTDGFDYSQFIKTLTGQLYTPTQKALIDIRLSYVNSFLFEYSKVKYSNMALIKNYFKSGTMVIFDLSDHLVDSSFICSLFQIIADLYIKSPIQDTGKMLVMNDAHNYLTAATTSKKLIHYVVQNISSSSLRTVYTTQDLLVLPPKIIESSLLIFHRFASYSWLNMLTSSIGYSKYFDEKFFEKISGLEAKEVLVHAPTGLMIKNKDDRGSRDREGTVAVIGANGSSPRDHISQVYRIYIHINMIVYVHRYSRYVCLYEYIRMYIHMYTCMYVHTHIFVYVNIYT